MIDIEDFTPLVSGPEEKEEGDKSVDDVVREYNAKLLKIKKEYEELLKKEKENAFREGFQKGFEKAKEQLQEEFSLKLSQVEKEYEGKLRSLEFDLSAFERELKNKEREVVKKLEKLFLSAVSEILEFLYISPTNAEYVVDKIKEVVDEFSRENLVSIEVGKGLAPFIKGDNVTINEELGKGDFRINFELFSIESSLKEKLELLREEFEREIKKSS
ncbi:hypothetical protein SAMN06265339_1159 [Desulfurobacterium pacificum]|uniref:Flagellar assembly protein FliH/Type III secretion system HrpE domain-containing protein n=1 Tax=Desulfurobacterium pacificum TaxID=240166 RepID=A0ABY1NMQ2_9BACT|nr:hypothetical protein [Desulfurobacterium pacificum]SMP13803.1 hypothetical protein SAMN06265339_1159 [Desulfurobacterium pacificum]